MASRQRPAPAIRPSGPSTPDKMQTQASQQHKQRGQVAGIAMVISCAAVTTAFLTWDPSPIGSADDNPAPARLSAVPAQAAGANEAPADPGRGSSGRPTRPMCAEFGGIASTQETKRTGESGGPVGCGFGSNLAGGTPASNQSGERVDIATSSRGMISRAN
jgi:hypothetical protein